MLLGNTKNPRRTGGQPENYQVGRLFDLQYLGLVKATSLRWSFEPDTWSPVPSFGLYWPLAFGLEKLGNGDLVSRKGLRAITT